MGVPKFFLPPDYWKIGKNSTLYVVICTLFAVHFFLSFFFSSFFLFLLFFSGFCAFFLFPWGGGGDGPPAPLKWRPWLSFLPPLRGDAKQPIALISARGSGILHPLLLHAAAAAAVGCWMMHAADASRNIIWNNYFKPLHIVCQWHFVRLWRTYNFMGDCMTHAHGCMHALHGHVLIYILWYVHALASSMLCCVHDFMLKRAIAWYAHAWLRDKYYDCMHGYTWDCIHGRHDCMRGRLSWLHTWRKDCIHERHNCMHIRHNCKHGRLDCMHGRIDWRLGIMIACMRVIIASIWVMIACMGVMIECMQSWRPCVQGRHFNFFLGDQNFSHFSMPPGNWKHGKNSTLYVVIGRYLSIVFPSFFFSFFSFFFLFSFSLGVTALPSPLKWRPCMRGRFGDRVLWIDNETPRPHIHENSWNKQFLIITRTATTQ